jgi:hypothetical protein
MLKAKVPAGTYHLVLDAVIPTPVDVQFGLSWRHGDGSHARDTVLATWSQHFDPRGDGTFDAQPFEYDEDCAAIDMIEGDQLVFSHYATAGAMNAVGYIPNGDGRLSNGRIPTITLPT